MLDAVELAMGNIPFRVADPERILPQRYYDEGFFKLESEKLWPHVWQMACRLEQISNVGDWAEYFEPRQVGDRRSHQRRREGLP